MTDTYIERAGRHGLGKGPGYILKVIDLPRHLKGCLSIIDINQRIKDSEERGKEFIV